MHTLRYICIYTQHMCVCVCVCVRTKILHSSLNYFAYHTILRENPMKNTWDFYLLFLITNSKYERQIKLMNAFAPLLGVL